MEGIEVSSSQLSLWLTIGIGVLTGILASLIIGVAKEVWKKNIEPRIINRFYPDVDISDSWKVRFPAKKMLRVRSNGDVKDDGESEPQDEVKRIGNDNVKSGSTTQKTSDAGFKVITVSVENEYLATIQRKGESITGTLVGTKGGDEGRRYSIDGSFKNLILTATIDSLDSKTLERGSMSLMLKENGHKLLGSYSMYEDSLHTIVSMKTVFERVKN